MSQKILITGASRGLGLCFARKYLNEGHTVFGGVRNLYSETISELQKLYPDTFTPVVLEVSSTQSIEEGVEIVTKLTDRIDVIINNAAIHSDTSFNPLEETDIDDCLQVYNVNALGPLRVTKAYLPLLKRSKSGLIVNVSSESGSISTANRKKEFDYCMSKAALNMDTKLLHNYLKDMNIKVIAVHPGWMRTDMGGANADLDPYETASKLVELFKDIRNNPDSPIFIDNNGNEYPW